MVVQPVRSLSHKDIAYFVFDPDSGGAGLVDAADDSLVDDLLETYGAALQWIVSTRRVDETHGVLSRLAEKTGATLIMDGAFRLGRHDFRCVPVAESDHLMVTGPLALFSGRLVEAGQVIPLEPVPSLIEKLSGRTRIYPSRGPLTTVWLETTFNSDLW